MARTTITLIEIEVAESHIQSNVVYVQPAVNIDIMLLFEIK